MTHEVVVSYDGCPNWVVDLPDAKGTPEECFRFMANHLPPKGCEFDFRTIGGGRLISYMLPEPTVARRYRLHMQDCKELT